MNIIKVALDKFSMIQSCISEFVCIENALDYENENDKKTFIDQFKIIHESL